MMLDLAADYMRCMQILAQHGIPITRRLVISELAGIQQSGYDRDVICRVLEAQSTACNRGRRGTPLCRLTRALAELELAPDVIVEA